MKTLLVCFTVHVPLMVASWLTIWAGAAGLRALGDILTGP